MLSRLNFRNRNRGKQPRANFLLRSWRMTRRKRVAYARAQVADTMKMLRRQIARYEALAKAWDVPVEAMAPLPGIPLLPNQDWVDFRREMGVLRDPVKAQPTVQSVEAAAKPC
jgi:hypothetical protein